MKPPYWSDAKAAARRLQAPASIVGGKREVWQAFTARYNCPNDCEGCPHTKNRGISCNHPNKPTEITPGEWWLK